MSKQPIVLRQSLIKALDEEKKPCHAKAKAIYIDGMPSLPSKAMQRGLFFETLVYGATDQGEIVDMDRNANGAKSEAQLRVEYHAYRVKGPLRQEFQMNYIRPREVIEVQLNNPRYTFKASFDMVSSMRIQTGEVVDEAIIDWKITESILSNFGDFAWGTPHTMDHIQAQAYSWAYIQKYGKQAPFFYYVMDLSPQKLSKFVGGYVSKTDMAEFKERLRRTVATIEHNEARNEWEINPSQDNCRGCPLKSSCEGYKNGADIQIIFHGI